MKNSDMIKMRPTLPVDSDRIRQLRILCQKPRHLEEIWSWHVLRRFSIYVTLMLSRTRVTPNGISWCSLLFFALTGWFLLIGEAWGYLLAILCYNLGYLCDCLDGELARLKEITGRLGVYVDTLIRAMSIPILTGVSLAVLKETGQVEMDLLQGTLIYGNAWLFRFVPDRGFDGDGASVAAGLLGADRLSRCDSLKNAGSHVSYHIQVKIDCSWIKFM